MEDKQIKEPAAIEKVNKVINACKEKSLIVGKNGDTVAGYNNILQLAPPLSITEEDFTFIVKTIKECLSQL